MFTSSIQMCRRYSKEKPKIILGKEKLKKSLDCSFRKNVSPKFTTRKVTNERLSGYDFDSSLTCEIEDYVK